MTENQDPILDGDDSEEGQILQEIVGNSDLVTSIILIGASALIPIPFLDDPVKAYLEKKLFRQIADKHEISLTSEEAKGLTQHDTGGCCALGCLGSAMLWPIKKILRKIFFFLEIKRAVDQSTTALAQSWLFTVALRRGHWSQAHPPYQAERLKQAISKASEQHGVKPLEAAVSHSFEGAKGSLAKFATKFTKQNTVDDSHIKETIEEAKQEESSEIAGITRNLTTSLSEISETYLQKFARTFEETLAQEPAEPPKKKA